MNDTIECPDGMTPALQLRALTPGLQQALRDGVDAFSAQTGLAVPEGWPLYPQQLGQPCDADWPMFLIVDPASATLVGSGGYLAPPDANGFVQIGYEIAPCYRNRGFATRAMAALLALKPRAWLVAAVEATNLASQAVLGKLGFATQGQKLDSESGALVLWYRVPVEKCAGTRRR